MKNFVYLLAFLSVLMSSFGCTRAAKDSTEISITLPSAIKASGLTSKSGKILSSKLSAMSSDIAPVDTSEINCFMIAVSGPEDSMRRNVCGLRNETTDQIIPSKYIGLWHGGVPAPTSAGQTASITLEVPAGKNREVHLIGFYAPDPSVCKDFKRYGFPGEDQMSSPYFIGSATIASLEAGKSVSVDVPYTFNANNRFDGCDGPDFPDDGNGSDSNVPAKIALIKDYFPANFVDSGSCFSVDVALLDSNNRSALSGSTPTSFSIKKGGVDQTIFPEYANCISVYGGATSVIIPTGESRKHVFLRAPLYNVEPTINLAPTSSGLTSAPIAIEVIQTGKTGVEMLGPHNALPGLCYPVKFQMLYTNYSPFTDPAALTASIFPSTGINIYSDSSCLTVASSVNWPSSISLSSNYYLKVNSSTTSSPFTISISPGWTNSISTTQKVYKGSGSTTPASFSIHGNNVVGFGSCSKYIVELVNSNGTPIPASSAITLHGSSTSRFNLYTDDVCSPGNEVSEGSPGSIAAGQYRYEVFARPRWGGFGALDILSPGSTIYTNPNYGTGVISIQDGPIDSVMMTSNISIVRDVCTEVTAEARTSGGTVVTSLGDTPVFTNLIENSNTNNFTYELFEDASCLTPTSDVYLSSSGDARATFYILVSNGTTSTTSDLILSMNNTLGAFMTLQFSVSP